jgi:hypothetical protein
MPSLPRPAGQAEIHPHHMLVTINGTGEIGNLRSRQRHHDRRRARRQRGPLAAAEMADEHGEPLIEARRPTP